MTIEESGPALRVLSLGAGVQSTTVLLLACEGTIPTFDAAIFADTGWEPDAVYDHLDRLEVVAQAAGIPIYRVSSGNIRNDALDPAHRFASMPLYVKPRADEECSKCGGSGLLTAADIEQLAQARGENLTLRPDVDPGELVECYGCSGSGKPAPGMARRQCTSEYKLKPIRAKVRELLGYPHPFPVPRGRYAEQAIGISTDEVGRAKDSDVQYARHVFPLLDLRMSRKDCVRYLRARGFGDTPKSACKGCPFHGNRQWRELRDNHPAEWADVVAFDHAIRNGSARANEQGQELRGQMYLHRSRVPLDQAPIDRLTRNEWKDAQGDLIDYLADLEEEGDPDGCGPFTCRSGLPVEVTA